MSNLKKRAGSKQTSIVKKSQSNITRVNAAGVPLPVPTQHQGAVKGAVVGGGLGASVMAFTALGPVGILVGGIVGLTVGVAVGADQDEKRAQRRG
ncbi:hypothetical protein [Myxococcus sp. RHSTA-1-4]|uniref:hypothetical protein n=1 Tax=Myxococcus sp. RHSTA-1-4 TaxID=2874601 RepID=UPI001CBFB131|nr:hypothetical protein [Myxococcus sp. RHSTA-1-4]MBZ4421765.1 hypothetical protein [Myxococcus sp. RHSTA-1-4]